MKTFKFITTKIFLRKAILGIGMIILFFMSNYLTFTVTRSIVSVFQGYEKTRYIDKEGTYIANLDPDYDINTINDNGLQAVYDYLNNNYKYAFYTDGFVESVSNPKGMEVPIAYMNEEYYNLNKFIISQGTNLYFDYEINDTIPVLIGEGLSKTYPVGSIIKIEKSIIGHPITLKVQGILKKNSYHINYYALNSRMYYNFSILVPVNKEFINQENIGLKLNGIMEIIITQSTKEKTIELSNYIKDNTGLKINFFDQKENYDYFNQYFIQSLKIMVTINIILVILIICFSIWNAFISVRLMLKDFTINLLVGLSYSKLRKIFYGYFGILSFINIITISLITAFSKYGCWIRKESNLVTYGILGLEEVDWLSLLIVVILNIFIVIIISEKMLKKIKKVPISLGVLQ